ncbi:MAG TPA: hypothetical protein VKG45_09460 [Actinomycetes bacterium]|nr:hypothetical protein [Actinomycetes bacterium]
MDEQTVSWGELRQFVRRACPSTLRARYHHRQDGRDLWADVVFKAPDRWRVADGAWRELSDGTTVVRITDGGRVTADHAAGHPVWPGVQAMVTPGTAGFDDWHGMAVPRARPAVKGGRPAWQITLPPKHASAPPVRLFADQATGMVLAMEAGAELVELLDIVLDQPVDDACFSWHRRIHRDLRRRRPR